MWYGEDAADYFRHHLTGSLEDGIKKGLRPLLTTPTEPPSDWVDLITRSWNFLPENRPDAGEHCTFFEAVLESAQQS